MIFLFSLSLNLSKEREASEAADPDKFKEIRNADFNGTFITGSFLALGRFYILIIFCFK